MPTPRHAQKKKKRARRGPLASIAEESAQTSGEEHASATRDELPAPTSRQDRLARRLARQKDYIANPGSATTLREFQRTLASTKAAMTQVAADLATLRRLSESGRATVPAPVSAVQATPPSPPNPTPVTATPFPLIPIPIQMPPPSAIQQIERAVGGCSIYIDGAGRPVAQVIPHLYFPWPVPPPQGELGEVDDCGDGHYYYPYFALPARGG